jgi:hypothetical protein
MLSALVVAAALRLGALVHQVPVAAALAGKITLRWYQGSLIPLPLVQVAPERHWLMPWLGLAARAFSSMLPPLQVMVEAVGGPVMTPLEPAALL